MKNKESGLYIILVALMLFMLMGLIVLVLGLGAIGTNKTRLQNAANAAALAALEGYVNADPSLTTFGQKSDAAVLRANAILAKNSMPGTSSELGELAKSPGGDGGLIEFGMWFAKAPDPLLPGAHCSGEYPCFEISDGSPDADVNSARVLVHNQADNPLIVSIAGIIGRSNFFLSATTTAALAPRCVAYVMDVSGSSQYETHPGTSSIPNPCHPMFGIPPGTPCNGVVNTIDGPISCGPGCLPNVLPACEQCSASPPGTPFQFFPADREMVGLGFLRQEAVQPGGMSIDCSNHAVFTTSDVFAWCNYFSTPRGGPPATIPFRHHREDYEPESALIEGSVPQILVDKLYVDGLYEGPQPLTRNFLAFNAGLRYVQSTSSPGDLSVVMVFTKNIRDRYPDPGLGQGELTKDMGFLIQLTNVENRGMKRWNGDTTGLTPEIHPNFIDRGWFPLPVLDGDATNLVKALHVAANALHSECLPTSRKAIVLATDGVSTCSVNDDPTQTPNCPSPNTYASYLVAENQLLNTDIYSGPPAIPNIRQLLVDWEISLTALVDSVGVRPNFYSVRTNAAGCVYPVGVGPQPTDPKCFVSYEQARALGYGGLGDPLSYFDYSSYVPPTETGPNNEENAYSKFGREGVIFGRPIGALGKMAIETGGFMCGLLATADPNLHYEDFYNDRKDSAGNPVSCSATNCDTTQYGCSPCVLKGNSGFRAPTCDPQQGIPCGPANIQTIATQYLPKSEQAARCVRNTVGLNPFTLVARDTD